MTSTELEQLVVGDKLKFGSNNPVTHTVREVFKQKITPKCVVYLTAPHDIERSLASDDPAYLTKWVKV